MNPRLSPLAASRSSAARRPSTVCVVDPRVDGYTSWDAQAQASGARLQFVASADAALRLCRQHAVDLWVINADLPGLSGCELCGMLRSRGVQNAIYIVAESYSTPVERQAWQARATLFGCKGGHAAWLGDWLQSNSRRHPGAVDQAKP